LEEWLKEFKDGQGWPKTHWIKLMDYAKLLKNVKLSVDIQDGVPVKIKIKEVRQEEFDLT